VPLSSADHQRIATMYRERVRAQDQTRPGYRGAWDALSRRLLAVAGELVVPPMVFEGLIVELVEDGHSFSPDGALFIAGEASRCHDNAAELVRNAQARYLATGYALSVDGLWRQHSWGVTGEGVVVETTEERVAYFGVLTST
jgi:hypothetical protein